MAIYIPGLDLSTAVAPADLDACAFARFVQSLVLDNNEHSDSVAVDIGEFLEALQTRAHRDTLQAGADQHTLAAFGITSVAAKARSAKWAEADAALALALRSCHGQVEAHHLGAIATKLVATVWGHDGAPTLRRVGEVYAGKLGAYFMRAISGYADPDGRFVSYSAQVQGRIARELFALGLLVGSEPVCPCRWDTGINSWTYFPTFEKLAANLDWPL